MFQSLRKRSQINQAAAATTAVSSRPFTAINMDQQDQGTAKAGEGTPLLAISNTTANASASSKISSSHDANTRHFLDPVTGIPASLYVLSGVTQPLLMTLCKDAGLADPKCQLYMLFYYLGPASVGLKLWRSEHESLPSWPMIVRAGGITLFDIAAQALNYTGAALAGPTIFAIVYSSVTIWTAVFSMLVLQRKLVLGQWMGILTVFGGLAITATDHSVQVGSRVAHGLLLVIVGSAMHGLTYVLCEVVMVVQDDALASMPPLVQKLLGDKQEERLSVTQNCAIQGCFAVLFLLIWQVMYTMPRLDELILEPMHEAGTTFSKAFMILGMFALANLVHALTYFFTLRHFPGGATSAGVMKGLQAVLVFVVTDRFFCGRTGGTEMCFSPTKLVSLITVVGGVALFGIYTEQQHRLVQAVSDKDKQHQQV